jgi:hypothetical protein
MDANQQSQLQKLHPQRGKKRVYKNQRSSQNNKDLSKAKAKARKIRRLRLIPPRRQAWNILQDLYPVQAI